MRSMMLAFLALFSDGIARETLSEGEVLALTKTLSLTGELKRAGHFLFVDLDDALIHKIAPLIAQEGFSPPPYFTGPEAVGAHISVAFPEEIEKIAEIAECGTHIAFMPKRCEIVRLMKPTPFLPNVEELYLLVIEAPELDHLREKYGLPKSHYAFHITLGVK